MSSRPVASRAQVLYGADMGLRRRFIISALAAAALSACAPPAAAPPNARSSTEGALAIRSLANGATTTLAAAAAQSPAVVLFWRTDCALCMAELAHIRKLEAAAAPARFITIALEPAVRAAATSQRLELNAAQSFAAEGDPAETLAAASQGGQRLPYALALDAQGRVCARHTGLLGVNRIIDWIKTCSV